MVTGAWATTASIQFSPPQVHAVQEHVLLREIEALRTALHRVAQPPKADFSRSTSLAKVELKTLYSAQSGSWPFEPIVRTGLFRVISRYQTTHPRALVIREGSITLEQLYLATNDPKILSRQGKRYQLNYPLLIDADAGLIAEGVELVLNAQAGAVLINRGLLDLRQLHLRSSRPNTRETQTRGFRSFIVSWAGSRLSIVDSSLQDLGHDAYLSRGISTSRSPQQAISTPAVQLRVLNSRFEALFSALELSHAQGEIVGNRIDNSLSYGIDLHHSWLQLRSNRIHSVSKNSALRLRGSSRGLIMGNTLLQANKAGIEMSDWQGEVAIRDNHIGASAGHAIKLSDSRGLGRPLLIEGNTLSNTRRSSIEAKNFTSVYLLDNQIGNTTEYALSLRQPLPGTRVLITGNHLTQSSKSLVRIEGKPQLIWGNNRLRNNPVDQELLVGDLSALQSVLLDTRDGSPRYLQVEFASAPELR
jgi:poly(beta-D-mannuronate) C5 epimerase